MKKKKQSEGQVLIMVGVKRCCYSVESGSEGLAQGMVFSEKSERENHKNISERDN